MKNIVLISVVAFLLLGRLGAQSPVIVQPANQTPSVQRTTAPTQAEGTDLLAAVKALEEMKAANEELLKKQQAVLDALDQIQKDVDQLRIYAKRG